MGASSTVHRSGVFIGTGVLLTVASEKVGFRPTRVKLWNETKNNEVLWEESMGDDTGLLMTGVDGVTAMLTADAIIPLYSGFSVGVDAGVNDADDVIRFEAWG